MEEGVTARNEGPGGAALLPLRCFARGVRVNSPPACYHQGHARVNPATKAATRTRIAYSGGIVRDQPGCSMEDIAYPPIRSQPGRNPRPAGGGRFEPPVIIPRQVGAPAENRRDDVLPKREGRRAGLLPLPAAP